ncbi:MAG TPA: GNAT family N-acetyltransferase [Gaiellaceae bacterium]|nr:GNAT family N-acetyltransferase [Gaiellaceae bacterium]
MSRLELRSFADEHLDAAGELLAARHRRHRAAEPLLPPRFEDADAARAEVEAAWRKDGAAGAIAYRDGTAVGYLVGAPADDELWGANEWIEVAGHAVEEAEVVRDLYAAVAARWFEEGRRRHYVLVPAADAALLDAWFRLSFGQQQAHAIREPSAEPWPQGVREADMRDLDALAELAPLLNRHQLGAPVFSERRLDWDFDELRREFESDLASDEIGTLVAELDGRTVGLFQVAPLELSSMHVSLARPKRACYLSFAVTRPEVRGSGAGVALTNACLAWAHAAGYESMVTDWRVTNLLASRFWPKRGFRPTFLRLYRSI